MKELNSEDFIRIQRRLLIFSGIWPSISLTSFGKLWCIWSFLTTYLNIALMFYGLFFASTFSQFAQNLDFFVPIAANVLKTTFFYLQRSKVLKLLNFLQNPLFYSYQDSLEQHLIRSVKASTLIIILFQIITFSTVLFVCFIPFLNMKSQRQLPFDYGMKNVIENSTPSYIVLYVLQGYSVSSIASGAMGMDGAATSLMGVAAAYFKILQETIIQTTDPVLENKIKAAEIRDYGKFDSRVERELKKCVDFHLAVISLVETTEEIFTHIFLLQFIISGISICMAGFTFAIMSLGSPECLKALGLMLVLIFQISLYCVYGEEVTTQSLKVRNACYMTEWLYCGPKVRKTLFIIMERSKRPSVLTAGKFVNLSHSSLATILRSAYSYGSILLQLFKK